MATGYKSNSQIARILTEEWGSRNLYCAACDASAIARSPANTRAIDYGCDGCKAVYQLKSSTRWNERRIPDAAYEAMVAAIRGDQVPNLLIMQYSSDWNVRNLLLVPSYFLTESSIEKRKPLSPTARRAGWVGCNILLGGIAPEGKLRLIVDGVPVPAAEVREKYRKTRPLAALEVTKRGWTLEVLKYVHRVGTRQFELGDLYRYENELAAIYPNNHNVRPKIRQQLQVLRNLGLVEFLGNGRYSLR
jgi:type II restriction enzyme